MIRSKNRWKKPTLLILHHLRLSILKHKIKNFLVLPIISRNSKILTRQQSILKFFLSLINRLHPSQIVNRGFFDIHQQFIPKHNYININIIPSKIALHLSSQGLTSLALTAICKISTTCLSPFRSRIYLPLLRFLEVESCLYGRVDLSCLFFLWLPQCSFWSISKLKCYFLGLFLLFHCLSMKSSCLVWKDLEYH